MTNNNYSIAYDILLQRYNNKFVIINSHLQALQDIPQCTKGSYENLRTFLNQARQQTQALATIHEDTKHWDLLIIFNLCSKLDHGTRLAWGLAREMGELPSLFQFYTFLENRASALETAAKSSNTESTGSKNKIINVVTQKPNKSKICVFCHQNHLLYSCFKFKRNSLAKKKDFLKSSNYCERCLEPAHPLKPCKYKLPCKICDRDHHTSLHVEQTAETPEKESTASVMFSQQDNTTSVLLATIAISVMDAQNRPHIVRALLDSGSQVNLITRDLADKLALPLKGNLNTLKVLQGGSLTSYNTMAVEIKSNISAFSRRINCIVMENITSDLPTSKINIENWKIPKGVLLADPMFASPGPIQMLIGAELFFEILQKDVIRLGHNLPILRNSLFGWVLSGAYKEQTNSNYVGFVSNVQLHEAITKFWNLEEVLEPTIHGSEKVCEEYFSKTVNRTKSGRYIVSLPFKQDKKNELGDSLQIATSRLLNLEKRFKRNEDLKIAYSEFMNEYLKLGHAVPVPIAELNNPHYYLPHHPVIKQWGSTKLRVVFDAAAKSSTGVSLNDTLHTGPKLQQELLSILIRFRCWKHVFISDIVKMYRQIKMEKSDQDFQRIVWRKSPQEDIQHYKLTTVTYGTSSAPYLAIRCLNQLAEDENLPIAAETVKKDCYVDDVISGANTKLEVLDKAKQLTELLSRGGFTLHKWASNCKELLEMLSQQKGECNETFFSDGLGVVKALGLIWKPDEDVFKITTPEQLSSVYTKRNILSSIAQIFDPLGLIAPIVVRAKMIMQNIWKEKTEWDDKVSTEVVEQWKSFHQELPILNELYIPRYILNIKGELKDLQCHGFADASMAAYGACIYVRSTYPDKTLVNLLCAKSKVAPIKNSTLPRLELCAAVLLARLYKHVCDVINIKFTSSHLWSDSTIVLAWLNTDSSSLKMFVGNRVAEIQEITSGAKWNHVASPDNPADLVSRGMTVQEITQSKLWWNGPSWLSLQDSNWPVTEVVKTSPIPEQKAVLHINTCTTNPEFATIYTKFSKFHKLMRVVAYCLRIRKKYKRLRSLDNITALTVAELENAQQIIIREMQQEVYRSVIEELRSKGSSEFKTAQELKPLNPFVDAEGLLRVGGRLENSQLPYSQKHPIILPRRHYITRLLLRQEHVRLLHAGTQAILINIRQKYWPINGRNIIKGIIKECTICRRFQAAQSQQLMGSLPADRVTSKRPFLAVGVDYAGPIELRASRLRKAPRIKAYIVVYICMSTKAVHLDLVTELSTAAFLDSLKRFVSRRGVCQTIYSDNGTNFVGASNELDRLYKYFKNNINKKELIESVSTIGITWKFIPSHTPHFGGLWERNIRTMKHYLNRVIGSTCLTYEDYLTFLNQVEAIMNSRPIIPLNDDSTDSVFLTPSHFLIGDIMTAIPEPVVDSTALKNKLNIHRQLNAMRDRFWTLWSTAYLAELQKRAKWTASLDNLAVDMVVLIKEDHVAPLHWPAGRIVSVTKGKDGKVRVATVKTTQGLYVRPIVKLIPLIDIDNS
ncbi:uncharacterized protein LOC113369720 [Ctenocephalides felis]|uniref:uncharacterized protein LOC113369720 n=1 Tax=Ctenocephalides felis TaxID=7515 RepID=UPI000E6E46FD|nr:uncharacterized protein LOC113369720 [Ctenocephalides felis]